MKKITPAIPDFFRDIPDTTNLNAKEVANMFKYAYTHGIIPKPDDIK